MGPTTMVSVVMEMVAMIYDTVYLSSYMTHSVQSLIGI